MFIYSNGLKIEVDNKLVKKENLIVRYLRF